MFKSMMALTLVLAVATVMVGCATVEQAAKPGENVLPRIDPAKEGTLVSPDTQLGVDLTVRNMTKSAVTLQWLDEASGGRVYYKDIPAGGEVYQGTWQGHYWLVADKKDKALGIYETPDKDGVIIVK
ncbi:MAG: hypothetical protein QGI24_02950 [Kiritimatiellia bacterium]|jgi:uncharacterized protein YceK|nr:hypothetical protein [Kiritimatiellia bacterium]MDP6847721.1 hypothetical protein [Kiritimatiellia bacterium]